MKKKIIALVAVVMLLFTSVGGTLAYVVTKTDTFFNTFAPTVEPTNGLTVEKTVVHPYGESYVMPSDMTFDFTISLGEYYKLASVKTSLGDITADEAGEVRISLKHGEKFSISELYEGTVITVTETSQKPGFTADEVSKTGVISKDENISFSFTNTYSPSLPREVITLTGEKLLEGREWQEGDKFTLVLEQKKAETWENLATKDVVYSAENSEFNKFDFNDVISAVSFGRLGTYSFRVSEVEGSTGGVEYDSIVSYFDIVVTDNDMDGYMEISEVTGTNSAVVTKNEEGYNVHVSITNTYAPEGTAEFKVNITKTLEDKSGQNKTPSGFTFELSDGTDTLISEPTTAAGETGFGLTFSAADAGKTFVYTLKEVNSGQKGYTYDETAYTFEVEVIDNLDGTVKAVVKGTEDAVYAAKFANIYDPVDAKLVLGGKKELVGRNIADEEFSFDLISGENVIASVKNTGDKFAFPELAFDKVGTHVYTIKEDGSAKLGGVTYDESLFEVTVTVTDKGGQLEATYAVKEDKEIKFVNTYKAEKAIVSLGGIKKLRGGSLKDGMFTFHIYRTGEDYVIDSAALDDAINLANGAFTFDNLSFENAGEYYFVVKEDTRTPIDRVTYDMSAYNIKVTISDGLEGKMLSETKIVKAGGSAKDTLVFENIYTPKPEDRIIEVGIVKTVKNTGNRELSPEGFEFVVENVETGAKFEGISDKKGNATIGLTFSEDDIGKSFEYKVYEKNTGVEGVTYSTQEYSFTVDVTLSEDNEIITEVKVAGDYVEELKFAFENEYYKFVEPSSPSTGDDTMFMLYLGMIWMFILATAKVVVRRRKVK